MLETISTINGAVNGFIWGIPAMICIIGVGLYLSIGTGFIQIRRFAYSIGHTLGKVFEKKEAESGAMTPFQAVCTALAGTVGTGNIAGVAGAIAIGGPGAVFWMWISALLGMCTKFSEVVLAVHFRERNANGDWVGGPMYFIKNGLSKKWHFLAVLFSIFGTVAVFGTGNATQINTIVTAIDSVFINYNLAGENVLPTINLVLGVILAVCVALVLLGGIRRIGSFTEKLVPFMAVFYIILALGVVIMHIGSVPGVFASIFGGAFDPKAFTGGVVGSMFISMRRGVSRGIFSNEAGLGTGSIAHATADTGHPVQQGLFGIFEVFTDTIVICTLPLQRNPDHLRPGCGRGPDHRRLRVVLWQVGVALYGHRPDLLCFFHDHRLGPVRGPLRRVSLRHQDDQTLPGRICAGLHHRRDPGSGPALGYLGHLQRPHGHPQPDRGLPAVRHGLQTVPGLFRSRGCRQAAGGPVTA